MLTGGVVLADVVVLALSVGLGEALEAGIWHVFLILGPANALGLEKIDQGGDIVWKLPQGVVFHAEVVTRDSGEVVRLTWVGDTVVVVKGNTLACEPGKVRITLGGSEVGVFHPDGDKSIERLASDLAGLLIGPRNA